MLTKEIIQELRQFIDNNFSAIMLSEAAPSVSHKEVMADTIPPYEIDLCNLFIIDN